MDPFSSMLGYLTWHYDGGVKMIWKSAQGLLNFVSHSFGASALYKLFPVPNAKPAIGSFGVIMGTCLHLVALVMRVCAGVIGMVVNVAAFISSLIVLILWSLMPFAVVIFVFTIIREIVTGL